MPALSKPILFNQFKDALTADGWVLAPLTSGMGLPRTYRLMRPGESADVRLYIWTLTHGGGGRAKDEWRIQPTGVGPMFQVSTDCTTLILGYEPERQVFAAFDIHAHSGVLGASPSFQIKEAALDAAVAHGLSPYLKASKEIAFGIRPDMLGAYVRHSAQLHKTGLSAKDLYLLETIVADPDAISPADVDAAASTKRRQVLQTVLRTLRDSRFRSRVLTAYAHRCGFCAAQLDLLDAAHVLPVGQPGSTDLVTNGVALCALHHRAYDRGLVAFDTLFKIHLSASRHADLTASGRDGGWSGFTDALAPELLGPAVQTHWPKPQMIKAANIHRGWSLT